MSDTPTYDYEVVGGDCLPLAIRPKDSGGNVIALAGYSAELTVKWPGAAPLTITPAIDTGAGTISSELTGGTDGQTIALPYGRIARHRWVLIQPDGCRETILEGFITRS